MDAEIIKINLSKKSSDELLSILEYSQDDYTPQTIKIINNILIERNVSLEAIKTANDSYIKIRQNIPIVNSQTRNTRPVKILLWIISAISLMMFVYLRKEISKSFLNNLAQKMDTVDKRVNIWTPELIKKAKENLLKSPLLKSMKEKYRQPFCDCYMQDIEYRYPYGVKDSIPSAIKDTMIKYCVGYIKSQNNLP